MIVLGHSVRCGLASPKGFNLVGFTWTNLVKGVTVYFCVSPLFAVYLAAWEVP